MLMLVMLVGMLLIRDLQKYTQVKNRNHNHYVRRFL